MEPDIEKYYKMVLTTNHVDFTPESLLEGIRKNYFSEYEQKQKELFADAITKYNNKVGSAWVTNVSKLMLHGESMEAAISKSQHILPKMDALNPDLLTGGFSFNVERGGSAETEVSAQSKPSIMELGESGSGTGQLCRPWGVCCNTKGHIIISDRSNNRIQVFLDTGKFHFMFGEEGSKEGQFYRPCGVAISKENRIVVADKDNHRIQVFTMHGRFKFMFGGFGTENGCFNYPWDLAVNQDGVIAVSDSKNHRIQLFTEDGDFFCKFQLNQKKLSMLDNPRGVAFLPNGQLMVTDFNLHKIFLFDKDLKQMTEVSIGQSLNRPQGIAVDKQGNIVVADKKTGVLVYNKSFILTRLYGNMDIGCDTASPQGVCFTPKGKIVVVDFSDYKVKILQ